MAVDLSPEAIARRLRETSDMSDLRPPFPPRVDMSPEAIARRLCEAAELYALGRLLSSPES